MQETRNPRDFAERWAAQGKAVALDQHRQITLFDIEPLAKFDALITEKIEQAVKDMVLIQKIVDLMALTAPRQGHDAKSRKFAIPLQALPAHD